MPKITVDTILESLQLWVEDRQPIAPHVWIDASAKLTVLVGDIQEDLFLLNQKISQKKLEYIEQGDSVAKAKVRIESSDEYLQSQKLIAKIDRITELVRISKLQARMSSDNIKNYT